MCIHLQKKKLQKLLDKYEGNRQKNPIKGRHYFLKKIDGTIYENSKERKLFVTSPKKNESFENFILRNGITTYKSKKLFMILNDLTEEKIGLKKKFKIVREKD